MDPLTFFGLMALVLYGTWNLKRNMRKAADAVKNASPEAREIGFGLLRRLLR